MIYLNQFSTHYFIMPTIKCLILISTIKQMKKYENIKQINLAQRERPSNLLEYRNRHSMGRSLKRSASKEHNEYFECNTDRSRTSKNHEFPSLFPANPTSASNIRTNIKTYIRFKPFCKSELTQGEEISSINIVQNKTISIDDNLNFNFDRVFEPESSQKTVYQESSKQIITNFINGYNGTIFAYGQTGSGKTYTIFGDEQYARMGIIPQAIEDIFNELETQKESQLSCSMLEIYKENIIDLLASKPKDLKMKQNYSGSIQIENLEIHQIKNKSDVFGLIKRGSELRKIRETDINERSSRSHLIFTLYLQVKTCEGHRHSKLNLVDLAGSQKVSKTKVCGEGLEQAKKINLSLSCLGNTINALSKGQQHIPFRDCKLTRILQQSLSGNSITRIIITCSLHLNCKQQTISSLKFGSRIKHIKTSGSQNFVHRASEQGVNKYLYQTLKASYQSSEQKLEKLKNIIENSMNLSKQELVESISTILEGDGAENQSYDVKIVELSGKSGGEEIEEGKVREDRMNNNKTSDREEVKIKQLEQIVVKQQLLIEDLNRSIEELRKQCNQLNNKKGNCKLKVLKINNSNRVGTGGQAKAGAKVVKYTNSSTQKTQVDDESPANSVALNSAALNSESSSRVMKNDENTISVFLDEFKKEKKSYEKMERQIYKHQINDLLEHMRKIKVISEEKFQQAKIWKEQVEVKSKYVAELENRVRIMVENYPVFPLQPGTQRYSSPSTLSRISSLKYL